MIRVSSKTVIFSLLCVLASSLLSVCVPVPIDLTTFVEDERIVKIIGIVILTEGSEGKAGSGRITGLAPNKYYIIERWDENASVTPEIVEGNIVKFLPPSDDIRFVKANGELTEKDELKGIGRLTGSEIKGLANNNIYRVRSAEAVSADVLSGAVTRFDLSTLPPPTPPGGETAPLTEGKITLPAPENDYYLKIPLKPSFSRYGIVKAPILPAADVSTVEPVSSTIKLEGANTETDYIFVLKDNDKVDLSLLHNFLVLTVIIEPIYIPDPIIVDVELNFTDDNSPVLSGPTASVSYSQDSTIPVTINIDNAAQFSNIKWYMNGTEITSQTGISFTIDLSNEAVDYRIVGKNTITVTAEKTVEGKGIPYSGTIEVTVLPNS